MAYFICESCHKQMKLDDIHIGRRAKCKDCGEKGIVISNEEYHSPTDKIPESVTRIIKSAQLKQQEDISGKNIIGKRQKNREKASIWMRLVALQVDSFIFFGATLILSILGIPLETIFATGVYIIYRTLLHASPKRATLGKQLLGLQVVTMKYQQIDKQHSLIRCIIESLSNFILCLGHLVAVVRKDNRALHDIFSGTQVVKAKDVSIKMSILIYIIGMIITGVFLTLIFKVQLVDLESLSDLTI